jgi:RNA polymerase-binding transcription factor DksA
MLIEHQRGLEHDVRTRIQALHAVESSARTLDDADVQDDLALPIIQMRSELCRRIDAALARIETGQYGDCATCGCEIPKSRLQALPFAVRCTGCEREREPKDRRPRSPSTQLAGRLRI